MASQSHGHDKILVDLVHQIGIFFIHREVQTKNTTPRVARDCPPKVVGFLHGCHVANKSSVVPENLIEEHHKYVKISPFIAEVDKFLNPAVGSNVRWVPVQVFQFKIDLPNIGNMMNYGESLRPEGRHKL